MNKLLSANLLRLKKNKCFWAGMIFMLVAGTVTPIMKYVEMKETGYTNNLDSGFFSYAVYGGIILAIFCSLFTGTEYSDGTIRNKIIIGHRRTDIYLANLFTNMLAGLLLCAVYYIVSLCVGIPLLGFFKTDGKVVLLFTAVTVVLSFAFSSIFTLIAMINSNKAFVSVISVLGVFLMLIAGVYLNSRLSEPKMISNYILTEENVEIDGEVKNSYYLEGTEREVYQFLYDFIPGGQVVQCSSMESENPQALAAYSFLIFITATAGGIAVFYRKDIK